MIYQGRIEYRLVYSWMHGFILVSALYVKERIMKLLSKMREKEK